MIFISLTHVSVERFRTSRETSQKWCWGSLRSVARSHILHFLAQAEAALGPKDAKMSLTGWTLRTMAASSTSRTTGVHSTAISMPIRDLQLIKPAVVVGNVQLGHIRTSIVYYSLACNYLALHRLFFKSFWSGFSCRTTGYQAIFLHLRQFGCKQQ